MKKALCVVSFGTSCMEAIESCILPVEQALDRAFPDHEIFPAFSSRPIIDRLRERGLLIESDAELLDRLKREGRGLRIASTCMIPGREYEKLRVLAEGLPLSEPLLANEADLAWMAALLDEIAGEEGNPLLVMGHGSGSSADEIYHRLREKLSDRVFLACVQGKNALENILPELDALPERQLSLTPLMLAAGLHARKDLAGDGEESWKSILSARGFALKIRMQGLGSLPEVQQRFVEKAAKIL